MNGDLSIIIVPANNTLLLLADDSLDTLALGLLERLKARQHMVGFLAANGIGVTTTRVHVLQACHARVSLPLPCGTVFPHFVYGRTVLEIGIPHGGMLVGTYDTTPECIYTGYPIWRSNAKEHSY